MNFIKYPLVNLAIWKYSTGRLNLANKPKYFYWKKNLNKSKRN